ncbi:hypothetical protein D3C81_824770 [compost metagenome]
MQGFAFQVAGAGANGFECANHGLGLLQVCGPMHGEVVPTVIVLAGDAQFGDTLAHLLGRSHTNARGHFKAGKTGVAEQFVGRGQLMADGKARVACRSALGHALPVKQDDALPREACGQCVGGSEAGDAAADDQPVAGVLAFEARVRGRLARQRNPSTAVVDCHQLLHNQCARVIGVCLGCAFRA